MSVAITIVTPTLNAARWLPGCLANVRGQNYPALEHIVVDGGSCDATLEIARSAPGVVVLERPRANQSKAINEGLRVASGDVVAWLNADDQYVSGALQLVGEAFACAPGLDVLYGDCDVIDTGTRLLWRERPGPYDYGKLLRRGNYLAQPAVFVRRRVFDEVGLLDESLEFAMDYELWLRFAGRRVEYLPRVLAEFRWYTGSKTSMNMRANWRELLEIVRRHGGGWTPYLAFAFARANFTVVRQRVPGLNQVRTRRQLSNAPA